MVSLYNQRPLFKTLQLFDLTMKSVIIITCSLYFIVSLVITVDYRKHDNSFANSISFWFTFTTFSILAILDIIQLIVIILALKVLSEICFY